MHLWFCVHMILFFTKITRNLSFLRGHKRYHGVLHSDSLFKGTNCPVPRIFSYLTKSWPMIGWYEYIKLIWGNSEDFVRAQASATPYPLATFLSFTYLRCMYWYMYVTGTVPKSSPHWTFSRQHQVPRQSLMK